MKCPACTLLISLVFNSFVFCQWIPAEGPSGGSTDKIVQIGEDTLVLSVGNGGMYKSINGGTSWFKSSQGLPFNEVIWDLVEHNGWLYTSLSRAGIYFSEDKGNSWVPINKGIENLTFYTLWVEGTEIYAGNADGGIYYSPDNGATWLEKSNGISNIQFQDIVSFKSAIYIGGNSLFRSTDKGDNWEEVRIAGLGPNGIGPMTTRNDTLYAASDDMVFISNDGLVNWKKSTLSTGATITNMGALGDAVYLTSRHGKYYLLKSDGTDWEMVQNPLTSSYVNDVIQLADKIIMSTPGGLYYWKGSWAYNNPGIHALGINSLNHLDSTIFAGTDGQGIFRLKRGQWDRVNVGLGALNATSVHDILTVEDKVYIGTGGGVYSSANEGDNWTRMLDPCMNKSIQTLDFDQGIFAAGVNGTGVYISQDTAKTWNLASTTGLNIATSYSSMVLAGDTIVVATADGQIFVSATLGEGWANRSIPGGFYFTYDLQLEGHDLYAATARGLLHSTDLGVTWRFLNNEARSIQDIVIADNRIYAAGINGVFVTSKTRDRWYDIGDTLRDQSVNEIMLINDTLYIGTFASSVWKRAVSEINLPPVILSGPVGLNVPEDTPIHLTIDDFVIMDDDNLISDLTLQIKEGNNYSVNADTIMPEQGFHGMLTVPVTAYDGKDESDIFNLSVRVTPVNDVPVITGTVSTLSTPSDTPLIIVISDLVIEYPDGNNPNDFTLTILTGENYTIVDNEIIPSADFDGTLTVPVVVHDGSDKSLPFELPVEVYTVLSLTSPALSSKGFSIYPNPVSRFLNVSSEAHVKSIFLRTLNGETLLHSPIARLDHETTLDIRGIPSGMYILQIDTGKDMIQERLVIE